MTIDDIRDQIAEWEGWTYGCHASKSPDGLPAYPDSKHWKYGDRVCWTHPIPYTLDEAAKLPEGWSVRVVVHGGIVQVTVWRTDHGPLIANNHLPKPSFFFEGTDEIDERIRGRHAAMKAERGIA